MDMAMKMERLEREVERLRRWQRQTMYAGVALILGAGMVLAVVGSRTVNAEDAHGLSGAMLTLTGANKNANVSLRATKPGKNEEGMEGIDFIDSEGGLRARIYWGHGPSRTTFALYNGKGQVIQALPID